jgi:chitinase
MRTQLVSTLLISTLSLALDIAFAEPGSRTSAKQLSLRDATPKTFDSAASSNIAVYFGRTDATRKAGLLPLCQDSNINIVVLAFITKIFASGGYPDITFDELCDEPTTEMMNEGATGLVSCVGLASDILTCQSLGTKILIGIGGQKGNATFSSPAEAEKGASMLWNVFGGGLDLNTTMRPFGNVTVDGFDVGQYACVRMQTPLL